MRKHLIQKNVNLWKLLRSPFTLPDVTQNTHTCEWEKIDIDILGCTVCGKVHVCEYGSCTHVTETEDGTVCEFSGVVIHTKRFVETEFLDTMSLFGTEISDAHESMNAQVKSIISTILCSNRNTRIRNSSLILLLRKSTENYQRISRHNCNLMSTCILVLESFNKTNYIFAHFSQAKRKQLINIVVKNCLKNFHMLMKQGMFVRSNEIQRLSVGVLYLMRHGVCHNGFVILEKKEELKMLLTPESTLCEHYSIHPKYITEMENRLKFCLRHCAQCLS